MSLGQAPGAGGGTAADRGRIERRRVALAERHARAVAALEEAEQPRDDVITAEYLTACVRRLIEGTDALVLTEVVTSSKVATEGLRPNVPGSVIHHGGGYLGWSSGAALGAALAVGRARPVVSLVGDGTFLFECASVGFLGAAPVRRAVPDRYLRQPRLGRTKVLDNARVPYGGGSGGR